MRLLTSLLHVAAVRAAAAHALATALQAADKTPVVVAVDTAAPRPFSPENLTAVAVDTCALKQGLDFSDPTLIKYVKKLGPGVLRIGGTDQRAAAHQPSIDGIPRRAPRRSSSSTRMEGQLVLDARRGVARP